MEKKKAEKTVSWSEKLRAESQGMKLVVEKAQK